MRPFFTLVTLSILLSIPAAANAPRFDQAQFASLGALAGRWRGSGGGGLASVGAFFEEYGRIDDSTLVQRTFADSSFRTVTDSTRLVWRGGVIAWLQSRGNPLHAIEVSRDGAVFGQQSGAPLTIRHESPDRWRVTIPSGPGGQPSFYLMQRIH
jgi:hypothetical protein